MRTSFALEINFSLSVTIDAQAYADDLFEQHEGEFSDAEERARQRSENFDLYEDALDFQTVSFEEVEQDLALELFKQDLADERKELVEDQCCIHCGAPQTWTGRGHFYVGGVFYCSSCAASRNRQLASDLVIEVMQKRELAERRKEAKRWLAAFEQAKAQRPDMNWHEFEYMRGYMSALAR